MLCKQERNISDPIIIEEISDFKTGTFIIRNLFWYERTHVIHRQPPDHEEVDSDSKLVFSFKIFFFKL